jgi:predicted Zn-dependent protease
VSNPKKIFWLAFLLVVPVLGVLSFAGYNLYQVQKQKKICHNARDALASSAYEQAAFWAAEALRNQPNGIEENKLMADLAEALKSPTVLQWRSRVCSLDPKTVENYLAWAKSAMEMSEMRMAREALRRAPPEASQNSGWHSLSAGVAVSFGENAEAEKHFEEAVRLDSADPLKQINIQTFRLSSQDAAKVEAARHWLENRIADSATRVLVSRALLQDALRRNDLPSARQYQKYLENDSQSEFGDRLDCLEVEYRDGKYEESLQRLEVLAKERPQVAPQLMYWMRNHQMGRQAIDWVNHSFPADARPIELQLAEADVLSDLKDWPQLSQTIELSNWQGIDFIRRALLARSKREQGQMSWAGDWSSLVSSHQTDPQIIIVLARFAQTWNWLDEARDLCWQIVNRAAPQEIEALERLQQIYQQQENTAGLFEVAKIQLGESPDNLAFRNNYAFLALLLNFDKEKAVRLAEENGGKILNQPHIVATLAFARLRQDRAAEARQILERLGDSALHDPDVALYYAAALQGDHNNEKAQQYAGIALKSKTLLPEEKRMAQQLVRGSD